MSDDTTPLAKVIRLPVRDKREAEALRLIKISDEIDKIIIEHLESGDVDPRDLAGLLAHRLGTLMRHQDQKTVLWDVCEKVLKKQAALD